MTTRKSNEDTGGEDLQPDGEGGTKSSDGPKELREARDRALAKLAENEAKLERVALGKVGLTPDKGMGKAIKTTYDGDIDPENMDPLIEFAKSEFDTELELVGATADSGTNNQDVSDAEREAQRLASASKETNPDARDEAIRTAEAEGDIDAAILGKVEQTLDIGVKSANQ